MALEDSSEEEEPVAKKPKSTPVCSVCKKQVPTEKCAICSKRFSMKCAGESECPTQGSSSAIRVKPKTVPRDVRWGKSGEQAGGL